MSQPEERRWAGRWGSIMITTDKSYFSIALFAFNVLFMLSFTRAENDPTDN